MFLCFVMNAFDKNTYLMCLCLFICFSLGSIAILVNIPFSQKFGCRHFVLHKLSKNSLIIIPITLDNVTRIFFQNL